MMATAEPSPKSGVMTTTKPTPGPESGVSTTKQATPSPESALSTNRPAGARSRERRDHDEDSRSRLPLYVIGAVTRRMNTAIGLATAAPKKSGAFFF